MSGLWLMLFLLGITRAQIDAYYTDWSSRNSRATLTIEYDHTSVTALGNGSLTLYYQATPSYGVPGLFDMKYMARVKTVPGSSTVVYYTEQSWMANTQSYLFDNVTLVPGEYYVTHTYLVNGEVAGRDSYLQLFNNGTFFFADMSAIGTPNGPDLIYLADDVDLHSST